MLAPYIFGRLRIFVILGSLLLLLVHICGLSRSSSRTRPFSSWSGFTKASLTGSTNGSLSIPELEEIPPLKPSESAFCEDRFGPRYLEQLRDHKIQYCEPDSSGVRLSCLHSHVRDDNNHDSFCIGQGALLDVPRARFVLDCDVRDPDVDERDKGLLPFSSLKTYWYQTGPKIIFDNYVEFSKGSIEPSQQPRDKDKNEFAILVKREGEGNLWHCLMEIWAMTITMDTLRMSRNSEDKPFFNSPEDIANTQVFILDDKPNGPYFDLWELFSKRKPLRLTGDMVETKALARYEGKPLDIIAPLPGASNSLWQNDWVVRDCTESPLLRLFVHRVFQHLRIPHDPGPHAPVKDQRDTAVTFIDRRGTRKLLHREKLITALRTRFPDAHVQSIDFASIPFAEQLRVVQETDVLVGVHGAGLTHTMFMREGAGAVVEIQPEGFFYKGFQNLAGMTGQRYFSAHAEMVAPGGRTKKRADKEDAGSGDDDTADSSMGQPSRIKRGNDWQISDVRMEEGRFVALVEVAIKSLSSEAVRREDVV